MGHEDNFDTTIDTGLDVAIDPNQEIDALLEDLTSLLKNGDVIAALTSRGVNASIALCAATGLASYLKGNKIEAADDLATAADEIRGRIAAATESGHRA